MLKISLKAYKSIGDQIHQVLHMDCLNPYRGITRGGHWGHVPPNFLIGGDRVLNCPPQLLKSDIFLQNINIYKGKI